MGLNFKALALLGGLALTIGLIGAGIVYGVAKYAGDYLPILAPVPPIMEDLAGKVYGLFQSGLGQVTAIITTVGGIIFAVKRNTSSVKDTGTAINQEVQSVRSSFEGQIASVKQESETAIGELKGQVSTLQQDKTELQDKMNGQYEQIIKAQEEAKTAQLEAAGLKTQLAEAQTRIAELQKPNLA